jgi:hypothetical protein
MPSVFKVNGSYPLPKGAEIVQRRSVPHVRIRERGGAKLYPLTADGTKYLRPSKCWYFNIIDADGQRRRVKGYADKAATEALAVETQRRADRRRAGLIDPCEEHLNRPWREHLADYESYLDQQGHYGQTPHRDATADPRRADRLRVHDARRHRRGQGRRVADRPAGRPRTTATAAGRVVSTA